MDGSMARHAHGMDIAFAQLVRDTDGSCRADAQRQHKCQVTHLVRDMMGCQRFLIDPSDDDERCRKKRLV